MAWENYALGIVALAGLEVLVTAAGQGGSGASNIGGFFGSVLPGFVNRIIDPSQPFFQPQASTTAATTPQQVTGDVTTIPGAAVATALPSTPAVLSPLESALSLPTGY